MTTRQLIAQVLLGQRVSVLQKAASDISVLLPLLGAPSSNLQKASAKRVGVARALKLLQQALAREGWAAGAAVGGGVGAAGRRIGGLGAAAGRGVATAGRGVGRGVGRGAQLTGAQAKALAQWLRGSHAAHVGGAAGLGTGAGLGLGELIDALEED